MASIGKIAKYVRSKNAGPFWITTDIFFEKEDEYEQAKNSSTFTKAAVATAYGVEESLAKMFYLDDLMVIKVSVPRPCPQGGKQERDMHSGQQYVQILDIQV